MLTTTSTKPDSLDNLHYQMLITTSTMSDSLDNPQNDNRYTSDPLKARRSPTHLRHTTHSLSASKSSTHNHPLPQRTPVVYPNWTKTRIPTLHTTSTLCHIHAQIAIQLAEPAPTPKNDTHSLIRTPSNTSATHTFPHSTSQHILSHHHGPQSRGNHAALTQSTCHRHP